MQNAIPTLGTISWGRRLMPPAAALGLLLLFGFAQPAPAQVTTLCSATQLCLDNNYFVTGDYVVGGAVFSGPLNNGLASGTITIPDLLQPNSASVPAGAEIVAAFLYWETVESTNNGAPTGMNGSFNGYPIAGTLLGNQQAPTSWSTGGCSGNAQGSKTMRAYRADVRPLLPLDANGNIQTPNAGTPGTYQVMLAGVGTNQAPFTLGASLVIIWRVLSPPVPLRSVVLYDGAAAPSNASSTISQPIVGFYQAGASPIAKMTHIVGNGQPKKGESVSLNGMTLPNLYPAISTIAAFPGIYNGSWDNVTYTGDNSPINTLVHTGDSMETTSVAPTATNGNCVNWGAIIFSTTVQDSDNDGLVDYWEQAPPNPVNPNPLGTSPGYIDAKTGQFVALPGANPNMKDIFVEVDYLCNLTSCDPNASGYLHSHLPKQQALDNVGNAFKNAPVDCDPITNVCKGVNGHFDVGNVYQTARPGGPSVTCGALLCDPYIVPAGTGGNAIPESATVCKDASSPTLCQFPGTSAVGWKGGFLFVKDNPTLTLPGTTTALSLGHFQPGRRNSYHYMLFGHDLGAPRSIWSTFGANLEIASLTQLISIVNTGTTAKVTIQTPSGLLKPGDCPNPLIPACSSDLNLDRVTVEGAAGQPALNGTYAFASAPTPGPGPNQTTFTITTANVADGTYVYNASSCPAGQIPPCASEPRLAVEYGGPTSSSGQSDFPGGEIGRAHV